MLDQDNQDTPKIQNVTDALKSWVMVALTLIFVLLYAMALAGKLEPLKDVSMITRVEPIIFVIIGYYFGRLPAQQNEKTLKDEINRQTNKADAAQNSKEKAQQEREVLEERVKNVKVTLSSVPSGSVKGLSADNSIANSSQTEEVLQNSVASAINILNS